MILRAVRPAANGKAVSNNLRNTSIPISQTRSCIYTASSRNQIPLQIRSLPSTRIQHPFTSRQHSASLQQWRLASNKSNNIHNPQDRPAAQAAHGAPKAESPWTEQPRSPAPGNDSVAQHEEPSQQFHSKLRQENEPSDVESKVSELEGRLADLQKGVGGKETLSHASEPLPDLRQGIPSTLDFNPQSSDTSSSFKQKDSEPLDLNITEDPNSGSGRRDEDLPKEAYISSIDQRRQARARYLYLAAAAFVVGAFLWLGREWEDDAETKAHPDAPNGMSPLAWYKRSNERLSGQFRHYAEPKFQKIMPDPPSDPTQRMPYTLVLSMEDLLVHSEWSRQEGYKVAKRPGVDYFIRYLLQYYELVIFTTVQQANAEPVWKSLDPYNLCFPIFRDGTRYINGEHVKDLTYLNRPLDKTIILDTNPAHTSLQPENAIILPKWSGAKGDRSTVDLVALIPFLEYIAGMELQDVRKVLASYRGTHIPTEFYRRETRAREEFMKRREEELARRGKLPGAGVISGLSGAFGFKQSQAVMQIPGQQTPAEALAEGKMLSDQIRERGQQGYLELQKQIEANGETWLKQKAEEDKAMMEEGMKNITGGVFDIFKRSDAGEKN